jgi:AraC-like DNA-binding protein
MKRATNNSAMQSALRLLGAGKDGPIALFDSLADVLFWIKDRDGRFRWVNTMMALYYGFKVPGDLLGRNDYDLFDAALANQYLSDDEQVLRGRSIFSRVEVSVFNHTGRWFRTSKVPLRDGRGRIIGTVGVATVLTDPGRQVPSDLPLGAAMQFLSTHYHEAITNRQLATLCGQSVAAFCRNFRRTYNRSPHEYLRQLRVRLSCHALVFSDRPLSAIASDYGFADQSHFAKEFRRIMGVPPRSYRARHKR